MIFAYADLLQVSLSLFIIFFGSVVSALLIGITVHEFSHCLAAFSLGDPTARNMGRLTLNPLAHLDPAGTLFMFLAGFGWGKPAPVNPYRLSAGPTTGMALVAIAGPISNLLIAATAGLPIRAGVVPWRTPFSVPASTSLWDSADYLGLFLSSIIIFNILLAVFNLIPLAPLDGFRVAVGVLPRDLSQLLLSIEQYGPGILILLIVLPYVANSPSIFDVMSPVIDFFAMLFTGVHGSVFG